MNPMVPKPKRKTNRKLLDTFHEKKCAVPECRNNSDPAHIRSKGAGGHDDSEGVLPLCRVHHTHQGHYGWRRFCDDHPTIEGEINKLGWVLEDIFGVIKLRRK